MDIQFELRDILKWIGLVFAAGFIGYFGRYLSMLILDKMRKNKSGETAERKTQQETAPNTQVQTASDEYKLSKKKIKLEKKKAKKQSKD